MDQSSQFVNTQNGVDHYARPYDHMIRIEAALSNTAARLYDFAENSLGAKRRSKDKLAEQLLQATDGIDDLHNDAVRLWKQTEFRHLGIHDRLKSTSNLIEQAKSVLSQVERDINGLLPGNRQQCGQALKVIAAQQSRLNGVFEEHQERESKEAANRVGPTPSHMESPTEPKPSAPISAVAANAKPAQVESATYRGAIIAVTDSIVLQQISSQMIVRHQRRLLDQTPAVAQNTSIRYSNGTAIVRPINQPARANELAR
jgi:hypothetical protein